MCVHTNPDAHTHTHVIVRGVHWISSSIVTLLFETGSLGESGTFPFGICQDQLASESNMGPLVSSPPMLAVEIRVTVSVHCARVPGYFHMSARDLNTSPYACGAEASCTEMSP